METIESEIKSWLSETHMENLIDEKSSSVFVKEKTYQVLTLKLITLTEEGVDSSPVSYVIGDEEIFEVKNAKIETAKNVDMQGMLESIESMADYVADVLAEYVDEIEALEDKFYERRPPRYFMDLWFKLKKDVNKIERNLLRCGAVLRDFVKANSKTLGLEKSEFVDMIEYMEFNARNCSYQIGKLDSLRHYYDSLKTDKLNGNIYFLALVSGIFLPLNLIVGFFGMNTKNMFFAKDQGGTFNVLYILGGVFLILIFGLPLLRILDQIILVKIFGRYNFYRRVSDKIADLSSGMNIQ